MEYPSGQVIGKWIGPGPGSLHALDRLPTGWREYEESLVVTEPNAVKWREWDLPGEDSKQETNTPCRQSLSVKFIEIKEMGREGRMPETQRDTERGRQREWQRKRAGVGWVCFLKGPLHLLIN